MSHDDLRKENDSLLAQQINTTQVEFIPPCLKCIERDNATTSPGSSNASELMPSIASVVSNPSSEETTNISEENDRLKNLLETGMFKCLKGHQTLCDILKKQILNRNPRNEGVGFTRNLNSDDSYWKPEQYPMPTWVLAKMPPPDPYSLSGYDIVSSDVVTESFDSNYKLFKDVHGKVFARYIGTNCRNGPPVKQIWVLKELIDKLPVNVDAASLRKTTEDKSTHGHDYDHVSANYFIHREAENKHAYSFVYPDASKYRPARFPRNRRSSHASLPPIPMWVVKKN